MAFPGRHSPGGRLAASRRRVGVLSMALQSALVLLALSLHARASTINSVTASMGSMVGGTYLTIAGSGFSLNGLDGEITV